MRSCDSTAGIRTSGHSAFTIGHTRLTTFALHHPGGSVAYRLDRGGRAVVIATDHSLFDYPLIVDASPLVIDTRNATRAVRHGREKIVRA